MFVIFVIYHTFISRTELKKFNKSSNKFSYSWAVVISDNPCKSTCGVPLETIVSTTLFQKDNIFCFLFAYHFYICQVYVWFWLHTPELGVDILYFSFMPVLVCFCLKNRQESSNSYLSTVNSRISVTSRDGFGLYLLCKSGLTGIFLWLIYVLEPSGQMKFIDCWVSSCF